MKYKICVFTIVSFFFFRCYSQTHEIDFVLVENDNIIMYPTPFEIIYTYKNGECDTVTKMTYTLGKVLIPDSIYSILVDSSIAHFDLSIHIYSYGSKPDQRDYKIRIGKSWLEEAFVLLKLYDLKTYKYAKEFYRTESGVAFDYYYGYGCVLAGRTGRVKKR